MNKITGSDTFRASCSQQGVGMGYEHGVPEAAYITGANLTVDGGTNA
ncbi:hypothetical protein [Bradyrhizobium niftali]